MACIFMPFMQLSVMDVISAALTPSGPPICTSILTHVKFQKAWEGTYCLYRHTCGALCHNKSGHGSTASHCIFIQSEWPQGIHV